MDNYDSYLDEGTSRDKLINTIAIAKDLALICDEATDHVRANQIGGMVSLIALRLLQIHKDMEAQANADEEGNQ